MCNEKVNRKNNKTSFRVCVLLVLLLFCVREGETKIRIDPTLFPASQTSRVKIVNLNLRDHNEQVKVAIPSDEKHGEEALKMLDQFNDFSLEKKKESLLKMKEKLDKALTDVENGLKKKDRFLTLIAQTFKPDFKDTRKEPKNKERSLMEQETVIVTDFIEYAEQVRENFIKDHQTPPIDETALDFLYSLREDFRKYLLGLYRSNSAKQYESLHSELKKDEMDFLGIFDQEFDVYDIDDNKLSKIQEDIIRNVRYIEEVSDNKEDIEVYNSLGIQIGYEMSLLKDVEIPDFDIKKVKVINRSKFGTVTYTQKQSKDPLFEIEDGIEAIVESSPNEDKPSKEKDADDDEGCHCTNFTDGWEDDKENNGIDILVDASKKSYLVWLDGIKELFILKEENKDPYTAVYPKDWKIYFGIIDRRKLTDEPKKERKLPLAPGADSFIRFININDNNLDDLLNASVFGGDIFNYVFNANVNGVKVFNVGAGNGIVAKTRIGANLHIGPFNGLNAPDFANYYDILHNIVDFQFLAGTLVNWIIDAGSSARPMGFDAGNNVAYNRRQLHEVSEDMADHFCPDNFNFLLGVIVITHTDADHYNLIYSILARCSFRYFSYMLLNNTAHFRTVLVAAMKRVLNCYTLLCNTNLVNQANLITAVGVATDRWRAGQTTFFGFLNDARDGNGAQFNAPDARVALEKTFLWQNLNAYFSDHTLLWVMPPNYDSTFLTTVRGFDGPLRDIFGARYGAQNMGNYQGALCSSLIAVAFGDRAIFPRNRIEINEFPQQNKNIQILNRPRVINNLGNVEGINPNVNSLMIRLRNTELSPSVLILGDAWMTTYVNYLIDKGDNWTNIEGTIVASHHGADTEGSHGITAVLRADRVIFSSGSMHHHPKHEAVLAALGTVRGNPNVANHYVITEGGNWRGVTDRPIYHTAGTPNIAPFHHYYSV